jgi:hypothetical protein
MMDKQVDKYPYKKVLYMQWFEAAIANLILFKCINHTLTQFWRKDIWITFIFWSQIKEYS